ncbi:MAG: response regulator transcription factor [Bacteroidia bacterium]|nr:response regulator transcription factor [Bacteroidia bacterium]
MNSIKVFIADAAFLVREGIKSVAAAYDHIEVIGESARADELRAKLKRYSPDLLIIDYSSPNFFSIEDIKYVAKHYPSINFLVITSDIKKEDVLTVLEQGVTGFLLKECDKSEIISAINASSKNEKFFCGKVLDIILDRDQTPSCAPANLTERETEIVKLMAGGKGTNEMAEELSLSVHTIYTHRKNIMKKLGVTRAAEVILYAINSSLIEG